MVSVTWARLALSTTESANAAGIFGTGSDTCTPTLGRVYPSFESVGAPQCAGNIVAVAHVAHALHRCTYTRTKRRRVTHRCMLVDRSCIAERHRRSQTAHSRHSGERCKPHTRRVCSALREDAEVWREMQAFGRHTTTHLRRRAEASVVQFSWPCRSWFNGCFRRSTGAPMLALRADRAEPSAPCST
jgi:hypothetical protein